MVLSGVLTISLAPAACRFFSALTCLAYFAGQGALAASNIDTPDKDVELHEKIRALTDNDLLGILVGEVSCPSTAAPRQSQTSCQELAEDELVRRAPIAKLAMVAATADTSRELWAADVLDKIGGPKAEYQLKQLATQLPQGPGPYEAQMHFAHRCEEWALSRLNSNWGKSGVPSFVWADAVAQFGKCRYKKAASNLAEALDAASLNVVGAACTSLTQMYPKGPDCGTMSPPETKSAWQAWLARAAPHSDQR